jgi:hypothetical protein
MKNPKLGDYLLWNGEPAKIIGETDRRVVIIELVEVTYCPHCRGSLGKEQIHVVVSSPMFQNGAKQLPTIQDDETIIVS